MQAEEKYELFDSYLDKSLDVEDKITFEENLKIDEVLQQEFNAYKETYQFLKAKHSSKTAAFQNTIQQMNQEFLKPEKEVKVFQLNTKWLSVAAVVVLSLFGVYFYNQMNANPESYYQFEQVHFTERSGSNTDLKTAETAFNNKNFEEATQVFGKMNFQTMSYEVAIAYGYSLIETKNYLKAQEVLSSVANSNTIYSDKANWYLALNQFKQDKPSEAKPYLLKISDEANEYEKAMELVESLD